MKKTLLLLLVLVAARAHAEGYQVNLQSAKQAGMGHTGTGLKLGAESMHFNPAALSHMTKTIDLSLGGSAVFATAKYSDGAGYRAETNNKTSTPLYVYAGFNIYKHWLSAGISVTTPYGSSLSWGKQWKGASAIQDISLQSVFIQPTASVKLTDWMSFGAGLVVATGNFELSRALMSAADFQKAPAAIAAAHATNPSIPDMTPDEVALVRKYNGIAPASATLGGRSSVKLGYNLGLMFEPCSKVTIGVSYRSKVKMSVEEGDATLDYINPQIYTLLANHGMTSNMDEGTFTASLPLPSNLTFGVGYKPNDRWTLALDIQLVGWGAYKELVVSFNEAALDIKPIISEKRYKNTIAYRIGAQYSVTNRFDVRMGAYWDETPVRAENYNPETPGANKLGLTAGFSFEPIDRLSIDFGFTFNKGFKRDGSYKNPSPFSPDDVFAGEYSSYAFIPSFGVSYKF